MGEVVKFENVLSKDKIMEIILEILGRFEKPLESNDLYVMFLDEVKREELSDKESRDYGDAFVELVNKDYMGYMEAESLCSEDHAGNQLVWVTMDGENWLNYLIRVRVDSEYGKCYYIKRDGKGFDKGFKFVDEQIESLIVHILNQLKDFVFINDLKYIARIEFGINDLPDDADIVSDLEKHIDFIIMVYERDGYIERAKVVNYDDEDDFIVRMTEKGMKKSGWLIGQ